MANSESTPYKEKKVVSFNPSTHFLYEQGMKRYRKHELYDSIKYFERAVEKQDAKPYMSCQLATVLSDIGDYNKSNIIYKKLVEEDKEETTYHYHMANNYAQLGLFEEAKKYAEYYVAHGKDEEFLQDTTELLEIISIEETEQHYAFDDELIVRQEEVNECIREGKLVESIVLLQAMMNDYPEYWPAYNHLAVVTFQLGNKEHALDMLDEILELNPGNLHAICNMVIFLRSSGEYGQAKILAEQLENVSPMLADHRMKLGQTFAVMGKYPIAYTWLRSLWTQGYEGNSQFYYWLAYCAEKMGNMSLAEKAWDVVVEFDPEKECEQPWNKEQ